MKKRIVIFLFTMLCLSVNLLTSFAIQFSDLTNAHWAYDNIMSLAEAGIINGYENGTYQPERAISRGEFLKLVMTTLYGGNEYFEVNNFNFGHWAMPYALEAMQMGYLMDGTTVDNLNNSITRLEMVNILGKVGINNKIYRSEELKSISFSDIQSLEESSKIYIDYVTTNGLINGYTDGTFKPNKTLTRAEIATIIIRFKSLQG